MHNIVIQYLCRYNYTMLTSVSSNSHILLSNNKNSQNTNVFVDL